ncbi:MAG: cytidine deaminase [Lachnospiraceae bacterium]|nr:cytidine deaminase [Lachnospiraceae bacterium]
MKEEQIINLIEEAIKYRLRAYSPYSHYMVGAALLTDSGKVYGGCNIENASFGATNCAERTAFFKAVSEKEMDFTAIAIVGGPTEEADHGFSDYAYPCGVCRQVMKEFCKKDFKIIVARDTRDYKVFDLCELLPMGFGGIYEH